MTAPAPALRIEAPSDAQLRCIRGLCADPLYVDGDPREPLPERDEASFWMWVATMRSAVTA